MTIHQAKGLEFPLVIVDVGSDFRTNHHRQRQFRYPDDGDNVHFTEDHVAQFTPVGPARRVRSGRQRAFDDIKRLFYVAKSRAKNVLILVGLNRMILFNNPIPSVALGDSITGNRCYQFLNSTDWAPDAPINCIALI
jgi:DNA helicase-2/ATP-dependent DNA helicase PcrA